MKRFSIFILLCVLCALILAASPVVFADGRLGHREAATAAQSPASGEKSGLFGKGGDAGSESLFAALETPEPTPFPTPLPQADSKGSKKSGNFTFQILPDDSAQIIAYTGKDKTLKIPETLKKHPVSAIGVSAFANAKNLSEIEVPEGVTQIGDWAFGNCRKLTKVSLPESVFSVGSFAFASCPSLSQIRFPAGVEEIGENVFACEQPGADLQIEAVEGSYAARYFQERGVTVSFYKPATPSPTPAAESVPSTDSSPKTPTGTSDYSSNDGFDPGSMFSDCPTCGGLGGCPNYCFSGKETCPSLHCSFGRCTECNGGVVKSYDYHGGIKETPCRYCNGGKCETCNGTGRITCSVCHGTGRCPTCGK